MQSLKEEFEKFKLFGKTEPVSNYEIVKNIDTIIYFVYFGRENGYFKLDKDEYNEVLFGIFIDLCHNLVGIKGCIKEGSPVGIKVLMRRLLEIAINLNILFYNKIETYKKLDIYKDFIMAKHHELYQNNKNPKTTQIIRKYEKLAQKKYKGMKNLKRLYRTDRGYMTWYYSIEGEISIENLLKKYKLDTLGNIIGQITSKNEVDIIEINGVKRPDLNGANLYNIYSGDIRPSSTSNGNVKLEDRNSKSFLGSYDIQQFQRDVYITGCLAYISLIPVLLFINPISALDYKILFGLIILDLT